MKKLIIISLMVLGLAREANATFYRCGNNGVQCSGPYFGYHRESVRITRTKGYYIVNCTFTESRLVRYLRKGKYTLWANFPVCYYMVLG